jgi:hypothetical protein
MYVGGCSDMTEKRTTAYWGPTIFGVPFMKEDRVKAIDALLEYFIEDSTFMEACSRVIDYNEKVVARCGVLLNFNSILLVLILFAAKLRWSSSSSWHKVTFYVVIITWAASNTWLMFSIKHKFPKPHEFAKETDFRITADLYIRRMAIYNVTLILSLLLFLIITVVALFPFYIGLEDKVLSMIVYDLVWNSLNSAALRSPSGLPYSHI